MSVIFSTPRAKALNTFKWESKFCCFLTSLVILTLPGKLFNKVPDNLLGPRMLFLQHRCHRWCHSFALLFSSLHKFHWNIRFISRTPRKHLLPRSWVKFVEVRFTVISSTTVATTVLYWRMICRWITWPGNNHRGGGTGMRYHSYIRPERRLLGTQSKEIRNYRTPQL